MPRDLPQDQVCTSHSTLRFSRPKARPPSYMCGARHLRRPRRPTCGPQNVTPFNHRALPSLPCTATVHFKALQLAWSRTPTGNLARGEQQRQWFTRIALHPRTQSWPIFGQGLPRLRLYNRHTLRPPFVRRTPKIAKIFRIATRTVPFHPEYRLGERIFLGVCLTQSRTQNSSRPSTPCAL